MKSNGELKAEMETIQSENVDAFPDVIRIEPVGKCNFSCIHCPTGTEPNNRRVMKPEKFNEIRVGGDFAKESQNLINLLKLKRKLKTKNPQVIISNVRFADENNADAVIKRRTFDDMPDFIVEKFIDFKDELVIKSFPAMV